MPEGPHDHDESNRALLAELAEQTLGQARGADDPGAVSIALETKGLACKSFADARVYFEEAADVLRYMGDRLRAPGLLSNIGCMASEAGREDLAVSVLDESIALARQTGDLPALSVALSNRALVSLLQQDVDAADAMFRECLEWCRDLRWSAPACEALTGLADIAAHAGQLERTAMLYGASAAIRDGTPLSVVEQRLYDRYVVPLRAGGDAATWQNAWNHGKTLDSQQAIATGLIPQLVS